MSDKDRKRLGKAGLTAEEAILAKEAKDEAELQKWCRQLLTQRGIEFINPPMHKRSQLPEGWPDFTFSYRGRAYAWECKTEKGEVRAEQQECIDKMSTEPSSWCVRVIRSAREAKEFLDELN